MNNRQRWWLEFLTYYDLDVAYHSGKANVVVDALSKRLIIHGAILSAMGITHVD